MPPPLRLLVAAAHPDDETLGFGGVLARSAHDGVETFLLTATRGQRGRYLGHAPGTSAHPGPQALAAIREGELRAAADALGIAGVTVLDYEDQRLDQADPAGAIAAIVADVRRGRPPSVPAFPPPGAYGHPHHHPISQFAPAPVGGGPGTRGGGRE